MWHRLILVLWLAGALSACGKSPTLPQGSALRLSDSAESVIADLQTYIPQQMALNGIPGVAVAYIRDGKIVLSAGFGSTRAWGGTPVTAETAFDVASNGKVVAAYTALRLVDAGVLELDRPVGEYLSQQWLMPSQYRDQITTRQILSHTSGLSNRVSWNDGRIALKPGTGFIYEGIGINYLQYVMEQASGKSFLELTQSEVFAPLAMQHSTYINNPTVTPEFAWGHLSYNSIFGYLWLPGLLAWGLCSALVAFFWWAMDKKANRARWHAPAWQTLVVYCIGLALSVLLIRRFVPVGRSIALFAASVTVLTLLLTLAFYTLASYFLRRWLSVSGGWRNTTTRLALGGLALLLVSFLLRPLALPFPPSVYSYPRAASTLRSSAPDLAKFLLELANPTLLSPVLASEMQTPQVQVSDDIAWGLGPGIQLSPQGNALWQWGKLIPYDSLMVIYPQEQLGIVVLTNSGNGLDFARTVAQRALGGKAIWRLPE